MKALLITKCSDNRKWYSNLIGCTVPLSGDEGDEYRSLEPAGYINFVSKKDCVTIEGPSVGTDYYKQFIHW